MRLRASSGDDGDPALAPRLQLRLRAATPARLVRLFKVDFRPRAAAPRPRRTTPPLVLLVLISSAPPSARLALKLSPGTASLVTAHVPLPHLHQPPHSPTMTVDLALDKPDPILLSLFANRFMSVAEAAGRSLQLTSIVRPPSPLASPREVHARSLLSPSLVAVDQHQGTPRLLLRPLCAQRRPHCQRCVPLDDPRRAGAATDASPFARSSSSSGPPRLDVVRRALPGRHARHWRRRTERRRHRRRRRASHQLAQGRRLSCVLLLCSLRLRSLPLSSPLLAFHLRS